MMGIDFHNGGTVMTNWGYKAVRKVLQTFGGAELAQQQSGRITGEPGNPEVATLARRPVRKAACC